MKLGKFSLIAAASAFFFPGLFFLLFPILGSARFDTLLTTSTAFSNFRSIQGGMQIGFGAFLFCCLFKREWITVGLLAQVLVCATITSGRLLSLIVDGSPKTVTYLLTLLEAGGLLIALFSLYLIKRSPSN
ncbi:MAG: DUF4345 family protein [Blastocatellia bacterium]|nr:DUF4345 family protein [Blastocatellia bacterium]